MKTSGTEYCCSRLHGMEGGGGQPNIPTPRTCRCPPGRRLAALIRSGRQHEARDAILHGRFCSIDETDGDFHGTPLFLACCRGMTSLVELLLKRGASPSVKTPFSATPLHAACDNQHSHTVRLLLQWGAELDCQTEVGNTASHLAAQRGDLQIVRQLVDSGADVTLCNSAGKTPYIEAVAARHYDVADYLHEVEMNQKYKLPNSTSSCPESTNQHSSLSRRHSSPEDKRPVVRTATYIPLPRRASTSQRSFRTSSPDIIHHPRTFSVHPDVAFQSNRWNKGLDYEKEDKLYAPKNIFCRQASYCERNY